MVGRSRLSEGARGQAGILAAELLKIRRHSKGHRGLVVACFKDAQTFLGLDIVRTVCEMQSLDQLSAARQLLFAAMNKQNAQTSQAGYIFFGARTADCDTSVAGDPPFQNASTVIPNLTLRGDAIAELLAEPSNDWRYEERWIPFVDDVATILVRMEHQESTNPDAKSPLSAATPLVDWNKFIRLQPHLHQPHFAMASRERQLQLQELRPIDVSPLVQTLDAFHLSSKGLAIPMEPEYWDEMKGRYEYEGSAMTAETAEQYSDHQRSAVMQLYDYLRCLEIEDTDRRLRDVDAIVVPGGRRAIGGRLARAAHVLQVSKNSPDLILSGSGPENQLVSPEVSEADAMRYFLMESLRVPIEPNKLHLERRATSLRESAELSLSYLSRIATDRSRPLVVAVITAPYVLRRWWLIARQAWDVHEHIVREVLPTHGSTNLDASLLFGPSKSFEEREYAFRYYLLEFYKLIGGRAAGEF